MPTQGKRYGIGQTKRNQSKHAGSIGDRELGVSGMWRANGWAQQGIQMSGPMWDRLAADLGVDLQSRPPAMLETRRPTHSWLPETSILDKLSKC